ncbi:MAG: response regulator [Bacteroidota bacterium]
MPYLTRVTIFWSILLGMLGSPTIGKSQHVKEDSIRQVIQQTPDSLKAVVYNDFADYFEEIEEWDSVLHYSNMGQEMARQYRDTMSLLQNIFNLYPYFEHMGDTLSADSSKDMAYTLRGMYGYTLLKNYNNFNNSIISNSLRQSFLIYEDSTKTVDFDSALSLSEAGKFSSAIGRSPDQDIRTWIKFRVKGYPDSSARALFMVGMEAVCWDTVQIYLPTGGGRWRKEFNGIRVNIDDKTGVKDWTVMFYQDLPAGSDTTIFIQLDGLVSRRKSPVYFLSHLPSEFKTETKVTTDRNLSIFLGILIAMGLYFLLLAIITRERTYVPYLVYIIGVIVFALGSLKFHDWFTLFPEYDWFVYFFALGVAGLGLLSFADRYLNMRVLSPLWHKITRIFMGLFAVPTLYMIFLFVISILNPNFDETNPISITISALASIMVASLFFLVTLGFILMIILGIIAWRKGFKPASSYLVGMSILIFSVGLTPTVLILYPQILINFLNYHQIVLMAESGIVLQLILFALGVGQKINLLEKKNAEVLKDQLRSQEEANKKLLQADKLKDEFLANTSHELRTPLNGILGLSEAIYEGVTGPVNEETRDNLSMIMSSAKRLSGLVNDILDFSKLRNYDIELQLRPLDFRSLAHVVMRISESLLGGKDLALKTDIPNDLTPVKADENRLQQILYNLIGNSIKFTDAGSVTLKAEPKEGFLLISVIDTGVGIAPEKQSRIFESFEQGDGSVAREYGGTGLGLSITRQLVELHGGEIGLNSVVNEGSTFFFTLPIAEKEEHEEVLQFTTQPGDFALHQHAPFKDVTISPKPVESNDELSYHILVVDDEPINRQVLKNHLSTQSYFVTTVVNGLEALEIVESGQHFDLVLLDVMMPKLSGFEVCQKIRENHSASELPIIMITAKNQVADLVTGLSFGANDYIVKPFSKNELLARINTHLNLLDIHAATSRFVPYEFLKSLGKETITEVKLGDQVAREGTIMFSDIRGYSRLAEEMTPAQTFAFLNAYLSRMGPEIQQHNGFVNQFYGDGIMALFLNEAEDALKASINMMETLHLYNAERMEKNREPLKIGIGLHTGSLMMGMIGDKKRLDTGLVADTVNVTSRIEGLTKLYGAPIMLSQEIYEALPEPEKFHLRYLGKVQLKGRNEVMKMYECIDGLEKQEYLLKKATLENFQLGIEAFYHKKFAEAERAFKATLTENPLDEAAQYYLAETQLALTLKDWDSWSGVRVMGG